MALGRWWQELAPGCRAFPEGGLTSVWRQSGAGRLPLGPDHGGAHVPVGVGIAFAHKYKEDGGDWSIGAAVCWVVAAIFFGLMLIPLSSAYKTKVYPKNETAEWVHLLERNVVLTQAK